MVALAAVAASLTITFFPQGIDGPSRTWTLRCGAEPGGTHPARVASCRRLERLSNPFAPVSRTSVCTGIYGGPEVARVRGTFRGRRVWATFNLVDGCQVSRWKRVVPLLPSPGTA